ncbi:MAG TPA: type II toxin-antitoxin system RelE/ParE family toxin [Bordetella sp.]
MKTRRVFKTRFFQRWMRKPGLTDATLREAVQEMSAGLVRAVADGTPQEICDGNQG